VEYISQIVYGLQMVRVIRVCVQGRDRRCRFHRSRGGSPWFCRSRGNSNTVCRQFGGHLGQQRLRVGERFDAKQGIEGGGPGEESNWTGGEGVEQVVVEEGVEGVEEDVAAGKKPRMSEDEGDLPSWSRFVCD
jgi:hypothetical protein